MIQSFKHKALRRLYEDDSEKGLPADLLPKLRIILQFLDAATTPDDVNLPGWRLHPLKGELQGYWSVTVSGNWRIIFRFDGRNAADVDFLDYH